MLRRTRLRPDAGPAGRDRRGDWTLSRALIDGVPVGARRNSRAPKRGNGRLRCVIVPEWMVPYALVAKKGGGFVLGPERTAGAPLDAAGPTERVTREEIWGIVHPGRRPA